MTYRMGENPHHLYRDITHWIDLPNHPILHIIDIYELDNSYILAIKSTIDYIRRPINILNIKYENKQLRERAISTDLAEPTEYDYIFEHDKLANILHYVFIQYIYSYGYLNQTSSKIHTMILKIPTYIVNRLATINCTTNYDDKRQYANLYTCKDDIELINYLSNSENYASDKGVEAKLFESYVRIKYSELNHKIDTIIDNNPDITDKEIAINFEITDLYEYLKLNTNDDTDKLKERYYSLMKLKYSRAIKVLLTCIMPFYNSEDCVSANYFANYSM